MNMRPISFLFYILLAIGFLAGCASESSPQYKAKPKAFSKINEISIVADKTIWEGPVGDSLRYYFGAPYLILPSPEPIFDLRYFEAYKIREERIFRTLRNYIFLANLNDEESPTTKLIKGDLGDEKVDAARGGKRVNTSVGKDKWAIDQNVFYLYSDSEDGLIETIRKSHPALVERFRQIESPRIKATAYQGGNNEDIQIKIKEKFGVNMEIPKGFMVALSEGNMMWLRRETKGVSSSLLMTKVPYKSESQLTQKSIRSIRDTMGGWITSNSADSYMRTNDVDLPMFVEKTDLNGNYAVLSHGIWEMENDFMGGPFVNAAVVNESTGELFVIDGFVFAPGEEKRNLMQYLDMIMETIKFE